MRPRGRKKVACGGGDAASKHMGLACQQHYSLSSKVCIYVLRALGKQHSTPEHAAPMTFSLSSLLFSSLPTLLPIEGSQAAVATARSTRGCGWLELARAEMKPDLSQQAICLGCRRSRNITRKCFGLESERGVQSSPDIRSERFRRATSRGPYIGRGRMGPSLSAAPTTRMALIAWER